MLLLLLLSGDRVTDLVWDLVGDLVVDLLVLDPALELLTLLDLDLTLVLVVLTMLRSLS